MNTDVYLESSYEVFDPFSPAALRAEFNRGGRLNRMFEQAAAARVRHPSQKQPAHDHGVEKGLNHVTPP